MNIENQIAELFEELKDFPFDVKQWVVRVIGFAVTTDRIIQPSEIPSLLALFQAVRDIPEMPSVLQDILKLTKPQLDIELNISREIAEKIFVCVLDICASDHIIQPEEYEYINELGITLGISTSQIHKLVNVVVRGHIKASFFMKRNSFA